MKSVRFNRSSSFSTVARVDETLMSGLRVDLADLFNMVMVDPHGAVAERVLQLCDARLNRKDDEFEERDLLLAARYLVLSFRNIAWDDMTYSDWRTIAPINQCPRCGSQELLSRDTPGGFEVRCALHSCGWHEERASYSDWTGDVSPVPPAK